MATLTYQEALSQIKEGDVVLFRGNQWCCVFPTAAFFISRFCGGVHTHVGLASWNNQLELVEFKEFKGGRTIPFEEALKEYKGRTDVFRVRSPVIVYRPNPEPIHYDGKKVTDYMRSLSGLPYSWWAIFRMVKHYLFGVRLFFSPNIDNGEISGKMYFVCSTAVAHAIKLHFVDLVPFKPDSYINPVNLANCPLLQYMFTIE